MTLVCGIPFEGGTVVASDSAWTNLTATWHGPSKFFELGRILMTYSGQTAMHGMDGLRSAWSLPHILAADAPAKVEESDIPALASAAAGAYERKWAMLGGRPPEGEPVCLLLFWLADRTIARFKISNIGGIATAEVGRDVIDPNQSYTARPILQCQFADVVPVMRTGLSARSRAFMLSRRPAREVSLADAADHARDIQAAAAKALPKTVGGPVHVRLVALDGKITEYPSS